MISRSRWKCMVRLGLAGRAGGEAQQRHVVSPGLHRLELDRLVERDAIELGVVVGGAVEVDDLLQEAAVLGARHQLVGDAAVAEREADLGLVDDLGQLAGAQHRHGVDGHRAGLGHRQPRRHHRRVVAGADQHAVAGLDAEVLDQRVRQPVASSRPAPCRCGGGRCRSARRGRRSPSRPCGRSARRRR